MLDVDEAGLLQILPSKHSGMRIRPKLRECFYEMVREADKGPVRRHRAIVTVNLAVNILKLDPAAGLHVPTGRN